jgi:hypothetical protein
MSVDKRGLDLKQKQRHRRGSIILAIDVGGHFPDQELPSSTTYVGEIISACRVWDRQIAMHAIIEVCIYHHSPKYGAGGWYAY